MEELNNLIKQSLLKLNQLKKKILSINNSNDNIRIKISIADIDRCIEHGEYYINDNSSYDANNFRFHNALVNLTDSINDNDFGLQLTEKDEYEKHQLCSELIALVEQLIFVNNKLKVNN